MPRLQTGRRARSTTIRTANAADSGSDLVARRCRTEAEALNSATTVNEENAEHTGRIPGVFSQHAAAFSPVDVEPCRVTLLRCSLGAGCVDGTGEQRRSS